MCGAQLYFFLFHGNLADDAETDGGTICKQPVGSNGNLHITL